MDAELQRFFLFEAEMQCQLVMLAARDLDDVSRPDSTEDTLTRTWLSIQGVLVSAANLSKLFWGSAVDVQKRANIEAKRAPLRKGVELSESSVVKSTGLRNHFEHYDNRLAEYYRPGRVAVARNIWPVPGPGRAADPNATKHFGVFDPVTKAVTFHNRSTSLVDLIREVEALLPRIRRRIHELNTVISRSKSEGLGQ